MFFIAFSTLGGLIFYAEYSNFTTLNWIFFPLGMFIILAGVYTLSMRDLENLTYEIFDTENGKTIEMSEMRDTKSRLSSSAGRLVVPPT
eukprot:UN21770